LLLSGPDLAGEMSWATLICRSWHPPGWQFDMPPGRTVGRPWSCDLVILQLLIIIIPPESLPNSEFVTFFLGPRAFFTFQEQSRNCRDGDFDGQSQIFSPSPPKLPRRHTKHPLPPLLRLFFFIFAIAKYRISLMRSAREKKIHKVPWPQLKPAVTVSHAHTEIAGSSWYDPLPSNKSPAPLRVRAWKDRTFLDHFKSIFNLFN